MYELKSTAFLNLRNIVAKGSHHVVGHIVHANGVHTLYEQGALYDGDYPIAEVNSWEHGLSVWEIYAA